MLSKKAPVFFLLFFCLLSNITTAQTFQTVTHTSGTKTIAGVSVRVDSTALGTTSFSGCGTGPYHIGWAGHTGGYTYHFKSAIQPAVNVTRVRADLTYVNYGEIISFYVNGQFFPIHQSDVSAYGGNCPSLDDIGVVKNGKIHSDSSASGALVDIISPVPIDSVFIFHETGSGEGTHYTFQFQTDPRVSFTSQLKDTNLCLGDALKISYSTTAPFNGDNAFNAELSDASGSFDNPVVIGTTYSANSGTISAIIPNTTPRGTGYRIRVRSTSPVRTTDDNGKDLGIFPVPIVNASSNSPLCIGDKLTLTSTADEDCTYLWQGPSGFSSTKQNASINPMAEEYGGMFIIQANLFGCISQDTVIVTIKPTPDVNDATNNGPICEGQTLTIAAKTSYPDAILTWEGPGIEKQDGRNITINPARARNKGIYKVFSTLNGCSSEPIETFANVKPLPEKPLVDANSPIRVGDEVILKGGSSTPGVTYLWTGPDGFTATIPDTSAGVAYDRDDNTYTLTATLDGCSSANSVSIEVIAEQIELLYPNPTDGVINIKLNLEKNETKKIPICIINHAGQVVQREEGEAIYGAMTKTITIRDGLIPGVYLLRMETDKKRTTDIKFFYRKL